MRVRVRVRVRVRLRLSVNEAMSASTRQSMRMVECVDAMFPPTTPSPSRPSLAAMCALSHAQLWLSS